MRPENNHAKYSFFKRIATDGIPVWYVRFWDMSQQKYALTRSTGIRAEGKRERKAEADACARAMLPDIKFKVTVGDMLFTDYLFDFWREDSNYTRERSLVYKKPLSREYIKVARDSIRLHVLLDEVTPAIIRDWMVWGAAKGMSGKRIDTIFERR